MADSIGQMHNRSAQCNDAMVKKTLIFDDRKSQMCTPPERLQGRIFEMCGPILHFVTQPKSGHATHAEHPPVLP